jgi:four helix bundle protein
MHNFRQLNVWHLALSVAEDIYKVTNDFPKSERFGLVTQMRRSAISIASNIAEGSSRSTTKDFQRFLSIARGSASELETQVILSNRLGMMTENPAGQLTSRIDEVRAMLIGFSASLEPSEAA